MQSTFPPSSVSPTLPPSTILAHLRIIASPFLHAHFISPLPFGAFLPVVCTSSPYLSDFSRSSWVTGLRSFDIYSGFAFSWYYPNDYLYSGTHCGCYSTPVKLMRLCDSPALILSHNPIVRQQQVFNCAVVGGDIGFVPHFQTWILDSEHCLNSFSRGPGPCNAEVYFPVSLIVSGVWRYARPVCAFSEHYFKCLILELRWPECSI